jgi:hypothetical protein
MPDVSVIIPFRGKAEILRWVLEGFAQQELGTLTVNVCIGGDGVPVPGEVVPDAATIAPAKRIRFHTRHYEHAGAGIIRNQLISEFPAPILIVVNGDTRPEPDMVARHVARLAALPAGSLVLGAAPWETPATPTVWDALLAETPMIFFWRGLAEGWHDFRHCWTLNLSLRAADFQSVGGFNPDLRPVYYEDLALGYRLMGAEKHIYYDPAIRVTHRHPTTLDDYLNREELLGMMAVIVCHTEPAMAKTLWGTASTSELVDRFSHWMRMDAASHRWIEKRLRGWTTVPLAELDPRTRDATLESIYQMHIPLKRLAFRLGFNRTTSLHLDEAERWMHRRPAALWRSYLEAT